MDDDYVDNQAKYLDPHATVVYLSLCRHAGREQSSFPSQATIAEQHGIGRRTVIEKLKLLEKCRMIAKKKVRETNGKWKRNVYFLLDKAEWKLPNHVQELHMDHVQETATNHVQELHTKVTHKKKETHISSIVSSLGNPRKNGRRANRLAGKPYSKPEWLLNLSENDVAYYQEEFEKIDVNKIKEVAKHCYYHQKDKGSWKKDQRSTLRNWLRNDQKWGKEKKGGRVFHEYK